MPIRRTASRSWRGLNPPGSGVPVAGADPGSTTSTSTERNTASQSSVAAAIASARQVSRPRATSSVISQLRMPWFAIHASVSGSGQ
jgi:hypothetical protein